MKDEKNILGFFFGKLSLTLVVAIFILAIGWSRHLPLVNPALSNFSPVLAIFFCGAVYMRGTASWLVPALAVIGSDLVLNPNYGKNILEPFMLATYGGFALTIVIGSIVSRRRKWGNLLGGIFSCSIIFYLLTNTFAWLSNAAYSKTLSGLWQALTMGLPGFPPTYFFLRNSLLSDLVFTIIFVSGFEWVLSKTKEDNNPARIAVAKS